MGSSFWGSRGTESNESTTSDGATLDQKVTHKVQPVTRTFVLSDLLLHRDPVEDTFLLDFKLQRVGIENSGKNQNSSTSSPFLRFKATGKEISLFSGLLGRQLEIEEERRQDTSKIEDLTAELQLLRDAYHRLEADHIALKQYAMETQRPRRAS